MTFNFSLLALDQVINNAAKMRHMSGGQLNVPIVFRGPNGPAEYLSSQHSQALQSIYAHIPGLKVAAYATPYDAKGISRARFATTIRWSCSRARWRTRGPVRCPEEEYTIPLGQGRHQARGRRGHARYLLQDDRPVMEAAAARRWAWTRR